ncbi:ABC transporter ATP-binding protein [Sphingobium lactosutens]|jgi:ABC-2 type transport system ATP-binding protein|uniref:ABC transporter ATP-binding protein n=1 Tax=Sphingobium lactosutens TaxID=522773 RepID=UPI000C43730D|nr:ATP-binding cassette domain-containing protein [Sphingobium lactosutens]MBA38367.1 ABC transporter ATP-binding protein [Sphingobium sp.]MBS49433.1 ABC transporter ATP-binding protein [Sphingobium sp.]MCC4258217.1 ATP-binding cassette domain-containing protein [Sphingobium lactosutens]|tara:strand:- start:697 stop:1686 length:990 start_codon:yes stop_codon:yes gene_type:complete
MIGDTPAPSSASIPAPMPVFAVEGHGLVKTFGNFRAVDGVDIAVPAGAIYGILGPNGAGKTTLLRTLLGIVDPDAGERRLLGASQPLRMAQQVGYLPEERGLYPSMKAFEAIAFMGALRGLPLAEGRRRAKALLEDHGMGAAIAKPIRQLSKGMAQTVQLFGTIVHEPGLIVLDEPFSGLDAINQEKLEALIREQARRGVTILFSTHVIAHAERLCERVAIIAGGRIRFDGTVSEARDRLQPQVRLRTRATDGAWRRALPPDTMAQEGAWHFALPAEGIEPLLRALIDDRAGIESLSIERPGLHDAFVAIAGEAVARQMRDEKDKEARA